MDFEIIDESAVQFAKRGRKANVDQKMVDSLRTLPSGKRAAVNSLKCDPSADTFAKDKARVSAMLRSAAKVAGVQVSIQFTITGVPTVEVTHPTAAVPAKRK